MAAPNNVQDEGYNDPGYASSSGNSAMYDNDDGILNVNPDQKQTPGIAYSQNAKDNDIITQINQTQYLEPGSTQQTNKTTTGETASDIEDFPELPKTPIDNYTETKQYEPNSYIKRVHSAVSSLKTEINKSDQERKEIEILIDQEFDDIIKTLMTRKYQIIKDMNLFYDSQKQQSLQRISELTTELKKNKIETVQKQKELKQKALERQEQLKKEEEEKAVIEKDTTQEKLKQDSLNKNDDTSGLQTLNKRLSIFGNSLKENASKLAVNATKFADTAGKEIIKVKDVTSGYIDSWIHTDKYEFVEEKDLYCKHEKVRLSVPKQDLVGLIENKIKLTTEWWDSVSLNHILFKINGNELWRTRDNFGASNWFNAFGTIQVRRGQIKRWNIKICERVKQNKSKKMLADVVLGIVESYKAKPQDKPGGFWMKPYNGFGIYGYNGKIFHLMKKGKMYCEAFCVGQTIGIELNMKPTPGMHQNDSKTKPKMYLKNTKGYGLGGGVVKFYVDDEDLGIAFYDLDLSKQYSLAVALHSNDNILQLCD